MGTAGRLTPNQWGSLMPAHNPIAGKGPYYYRDTELFMAEFATDPEVVLDLLPSDLELMEPAGGFMIMEQNHWTSNGPYGEVYLGVMCTWQGQPHAYVPGVYVTTENSQLLGREIWGFGKKRAHKFELIKHGNSQVEAIMEILPGDRALRAVMQPQKNEPADSMVDCPLICLRIVPDAEGGDVPALAQLVQVSFSANPIIGSDGKAEIYSGPGSLRMEDPSDINIPVLGVGKCTYLRFNADLPYGKVLKTYSPKEFD